MIQLNSIKRAEALLETLQDVKEKLEQKINLGNYHDQKIQTISGNKIMKICLLVGLSHHEDRKREDFESLKISSNGIFDDFFTNHNLSPLISALLKLRYHHLDIDWDYNPTKNKIINAEIVRGRKVLLENNFLEEWLLTPSNLNENHIGQIPFLNLPIGFYEDEIEAYLNLNGKDISNTQILVAGTTGSGKSNLLAVLLHTIRSLSVDTSYPVNFLLFDYKGEFADPQNHSWLKLFEVDKTCILNPIEKPLPFSPFKNFVGKSQNEINLYSTELAGALCAIDAARISANMNNRLSEAIINAYAKNEHEAIHFELILREYTRLQPEKDQEKDDSIKSVLKQLIRSNLFEKEDQIDLIRNSFIIKMDGFPKDGVLAKAIVYFIISKLNIIYEKLPKQASNEKNVELRHFTIIDEAHYMLDFDNKALRDLIAIGRNKGLSIILATQNMDSYKSEFFDFYANAQYPLIMKQQSINDSVIKDLFGVSGKEFQEIKEAIASLQKGELIIKNTDAIILGIGKKYKKIKESHLI